MSVRLDVLNGVTTKTYGFTAGDWENRPADKNLFVLAKHHFGAKPSEVAKFGGYSEPINLHGLGAEKLGEVFNDVFQRYQPTCTIDVPTVVNTEAGPVRTTVKGNFKPTAIYLTVTYGTIPDDAVLFVAGIKV